MMYGRNNAVWMPGALFIATLITFTFSGFFYLIFREYFGLFHTRDYQFYYFNFKYSLDVLLRHVHGINIHPNGYNIFGFYGADGFPDLGDDIHLSPIKYFISSIYKLGGIHSVYAFYSIFCAASVSTFTLAVSRTWKESLLLAFLLIIPVTVLSGYDLRTYNLMSASLLLSWASIYKKAPNWVILSAATLTLLCREDAAIFLSLAGIFLATQARFKLGFTIAVICFLWSLFGFLLYLGSDFLWGRGTKIAIVFFGVQLFVVVGFILLQCINFRFAPNADLSGDKYDIKVGAFLVLSTAPIIYQIGISAFYGNPRAFIFHVALSFFCIAIWRRRSWLLKILCLPLVFALVYSSLFSIRSIRAEWMSADLEQIRAVKSFERELPANSTVVTSLELHQFFLDHNAYAYQRLPATRHDDESRFFPANIERLDLLLSKSDYVFLSARDFDEISSLSKSSLKCDRWAKLMLVCAINSANDPRRK